MNCCFLLFLDDKVRVARRLKSIYGRKSIEDSSPGKAVGLERARRKGKMGCLQRVSNSAEMTGICYSLTL